MRVPPPAATRGSTRDHPPGAPAAPPVGRPWHAHSCRAWTGAPCRGARAVGAPCQMLAAAARVRGWREISHLRGGGRQGDAPPAAADHSAGHGESTPRVKNGNTRRESMTIDASHKHVQGPEGERDDRTCPEHNHRVTHLPVALTGHGARVGSSTQSGPALLTPHTTPASTGDMQRPTPAVRRRYCSRRVTPPRGASGRVLL